MPAHPLRISVALLAGLGMALTTSCEAFLVGLNATANVASAVASSQAASSGGAGAALDPECTGDDCTPPAEARESSDPPAASTPGDEPSYGEIGRGTCEDDGASCKADGAVAAAKERCERTRGQRDCHCAAAFTLECFIRHQCTRDDGASTDVTRARLEAARDSEDQKARQFGKGCF
jgi:hypothetical protein